MLDNWRGYIVCFICVRTLILCLTLILGTRAQAQTSIDVTVKGQVPITCTLTAPTGAVELNTLINAFGGAVAASGNSSILIPMSCNAPFQVSFQSQNGTLLNPNWVIRQGSFTSAIPYWLSWSVPLDNGMILSEANCTSASIVSTAGCGLTSTYSAINRSMKTSFAWDAPATPLLAGTYLDRITIRITAQSW